MGLLDFWKKKQAAEAAPEASAEASPEAAPEGVEAAGEQGQEAAPVPPEQPQAAPVTETLAPSTVSPQAAPADPVAAPEPEPESEPEPQPEPAPVKKKGFLARLAQRLGQTREKISGSIDRLTLGRRIDDGLLDELEEVLVTADLGVKTSLELIEGLRGAVRRQELHDAEALKLALRAGIERVLMSVAPPPSRENNPHVIMVVGVNGVGKTTTIGKLAHYFQEQGRTVLLGASDTFRAAAAEQLEVWAERVGADIVRQKHGARSLAPWPMTPWRPPRTGAATW